MNIFIYYSNTFKAHISACVQCSWRLLSIASMALTSSFVHEPAEFHMNLKYYHNISIHLDEQERSPTALWLCATTISTAQLCTGCKRCATIQSICSTTKYSNTHCKCQFQFLQQFPVLFMPTAMFSN